ncbi:MAG: LPS export ABC transporter periplasmic protein LptC [bacterium]
MRLKIFIFVLILIGIISFLLIKNTGKIKEKDKIPATEFSDSESGLKGFYLVETISGKPQWELLAKKAAMSPTHTKLEQIKCIFFSDNKPVLTVEAQNGILDTQTRDIELKGQVKATNEEGTEFRSDTLNWRAKPQIFITPDRVDIIHKKVHISGFGLEIDPEKEKIEIKEQVRIKIES